MAKNRKLTVALVCIALLALFSVIYRVTEIILFKGTEGYSVLSNVTGMLALVFLYALLFVALLKEWRWGFWYGLVLLIFLLIAYLLKSPFVWPYAVNSILFIIVIVLLFKLKKKK